MPTPPSMYALSALVELHDSMVVSPWPIIAGAALKSTVGGPMGITTVTVALADATPPGPVAVRVYMVVFSREINLKPLGSTGPMPGSMTQESAFAVCQVRVADSPRLMVVGSVVKAII